MSYQRADTEWMKGNFGISVHWTTHSVFEDGTTCPFEEAVNNFDVERFADSVQASGAKHLIFTLAHAEQYLAMPNEELERLLPGRTTKRDLIGEIIQALKKRSIRFIAYYNHGCNNHDDPPWTKACSYAEGIKGNLDLFADNICRIVSWIGKRYGKDLAGWWFDSGYGVDPKGPNNFLVVDLGDWQFPWEKLCAAAKSGNPDAAVAFNAGVGTRFLYAPCQDYYCGETVHLDEVFSPEAEPGIRDHRWICADSPAWVFGKKAAEKGFCDPQFTDEQIGNFIHEHLSAGRMVTLNVLVDRSGKINPKALAQLSRLPPRKYEI